ncbi:MAG TPA: MucB/RseB C-terminal domain-containing protein [Steroidobacteraceae bacterium]|jgi:sigma-E factor negative regulatory protein RseB|nr:MucB/RseB C-terminal domain-containing protein [Steroidobacteraceae bacterium]
MMLRLVGAIVFSLIASVAHAESDARNWLVRMSASLTERNYDGRFIHSSDTQSETLRIVHRNVKGGITERLVSLDGSGREYIRTNTKTTYYMPDTRTVVVEDRIDNDGLLTLIPEYRAGLENYYDITMGQETMVLGKRAILVNVQPRDEFRYGYRLWLDMETAMPLKSQLFNHHGKIVEQVAFAELAVKDSIPDADLQTSINTSGYSQLRQEARRHFISPDSIGWRVTNLPPGFKLKVTRLQSMAGSKSPVRHMVYSDGLATVSVFIEPANGKDNQGSGLQRVGSVFAFHSDNSGYQVTAVGEVPPLTVKSIVGSLMRDGANGSSISVSANASAK